MTKNNENGSTVNVYIGGYTWEPPKNIQPNNGATWVSSIIVDGLHMDLARSDGELRMARARVAMQDAEIASLKKRVAHLRALARQSGKPE